MQTKAAKRDKWLVIIGTMKLLKGALLLALAFGVIKLLHRDIVEMLNHWIQRLHLDVQNPLFEKIIAKLAGLTPHKLALVSAGTFVYSGLFLTEGIGLLLQKRWAEYFTVIVTGSFLPFEIYELAAKEFSVAKLVLLLANVAILIYLIWRLKHHR